MSVQNLIVADVAADDGYGASAIGMQNNATLGVSGYQSGWLCWYWARFITTAAIAQASLINSAIVKLAAFDTDSSTTWVAVAKFQKIANAPSTTSSFANLSGRTYTTAGVTFTNTAITSPAYTNFDVTAPFQELVDAYGIASGDAILFTLQYATSTTFRRFFTRDAGIDTAPKLDIDYTAPVLGSVPVPILFGRQNTLLRM